VFDIYTIIFLALAVFIFLRLRSVLGQRTGRERPPFDPFARRDMPRPTGGDNVVALPGRAPDAPQKSTEPAPDRWQGVAEAGSAVAGGLDAIVRADPGFDPQQFIAGARGAYEMIVTAFAAAIAASSRICSAARSTTASSTPSASASRRAKPWRRASSPSIRPTSSAPSCAPTWRRSRCGSSRSWFRRRATAPATSSTAAPTRSPK
jgi:hypothetical protein